ncbi:MAG: hypothetical protein ACFE75_04600 [Candidatus Hodarchaeota archaeon]
MELTPGKIYDEYLTNNLDKSSAIKLLLSLIENSDSNNLRVDGIKELERIKADDSNTFKFLENLLISDSNEAVRTTTAIVLRNLFKDKSLEPMKWALIHENSPSCLETIYLTLIEITKKMVEFQNSIYRSILLKEVKKIRRKEFRFGYELLSERKEIEQFTKNELGDILINYFTIIYLEKTYWRLKYKIENSRIVELNFIFKGLTNLPKAIKYSTYLKTLILRYNQLTQLPDWLGSLNSLEILNLNMNNLNILPESIGSLSKLRELHLWKNELTTLPHTIGNLSQLEILNLRLNKLNSLPETIKNLQSLRDLNLHDNELSYLPKSLSSLNSLEQLNLSWNNVKVLPETLGFLTSLKTLNLERNEIINLPENIGSLSSLEFLNLSENKLKKIPDSIGNISSLQYLNLSRNNLTSIPKSIESIISLKELYLGENDISMIPKSLKNLEIYGLKIYF